MGILWKEVLQMSAFDIALYILKVIGAILIIINNGFGLYLKIHEYRANKKK